MKFYDVIVWTPLTYCVVASSEEEAFKKAEELPLHMYDDCSVDDRYMAERGGVYDWDQLVMDGYADPHEEFYIDGVPVTEEEFRAFGHKHLVTYTLGSPEHPESDSFALHFRTSDIHKE